MATPAFPVVNGKTYDFSAIETSIPIAGIVREVSEITYTDSVDRGELRAGNPWAEASTRGEYSAECSITLSKQHHILLLSSLDELSAGKGPYDVEFPLTVVTQRAGMPTVKDLLKKATLIGGEGGGSTGTDALMITVPVHIHAVYWNGIAPFADMPF